MRNLDENTITEAVIARHQGMDDARLRQIMTSLVRHLHAFAKDVELTEAEWMTGIEFLTAVGQMCSEQRQEFILLSDVLGLSMLVTALNHKKPAGCTEATVLGPFHVDHAPEYELGQDIANGAKGETCFVRGTIRSTDGSAIPDAVMEVWQSDADGLYDVQHEGLDEAMARGILRSDANGGYHFQTICAEAYAIPHDGPVGGLLQALGRHPWRPAHLHFLIKAQGHETLVTHVFRRDDEYLDSDAVFGVRSSLIGDWVRHESGVAPDGTPMQQPFYTLDFDFVLNPLASERAA